MVPTTYTEVFLFLLLAVGAAAFLGTGAALLRYRRTGMFPGEEAGGEGGAAGGRGDGGRARVRNAAVKCGVGAVMVVWALATLIVQRGS